MHYNVCNCFLLFQVIGLPLGYIVRSISGFVTGFIVLLEASWALGLVLLPIYIVMMTGQIIQVILTQKFICKIKKYLGESSKIAVEAIENFHTMTTLGITNLIERMYQQKLKKPFR